MIASLRNDIEQSNNYYYDGLWNPSKNYIIMFTWECIFLKLISIASNFL